MKSIQTNNKNSFNKKVSFHKGISVEFDEKGIVEVEEEIANELLSEYPDVLFEKGKLPKVESKKKETKDDSIEVQRLRDLVETKDRLIDGLKSKTEELKKDLESWKSEVDKFSKENEELKKELASIGKGEDDAIQKELMGKSAEEVKQTAIEVGLTAVEIGKLKTKKELVDAIIAKTK